MRIQANDLICFLVLSLVSFCLSACDGGGGTTFAGGGGGIVGTGKQVTVTGEVTGFGSIIVNGIEFTRSTAPGVSPTPVVMAFENVLSANESVLRPGMVVMLSGIYDTATNRGSYSQIIYSPELRGALDDGSVNAASGLFSVLGRTVQAGASTIFDGISDINELLMRQSQGLELEVSGYLVSGGVLQATRVALKSSGFSNGAVQIKGQVSAFNGSTFVIDGVTVVISGATFVGMSAADLGNAGMVVEVRGTLSGSTISSARIERKSASSGVNSGNSLNIKGVSAGVPLAGSFVLSGPDGPLLVKISGAVFYRGSGVSDASIIVPGARLDVEGVVLADGSLAATEISVESEKTVRLEGDVTGVNVLSGTVTLVGVTVTTVSGTSYRDNRSPPVGVLTISGLAIGDHLQLYGFLDDTGRIIASQVERFSASNVNILQGPVTALNVGSSQLTILGISVTAQPGADLSKGGVSYPAFASFASQIALGSTVVKAKGISSGSAFAADSLEIQQ